MAMIAAIHGEYRPDMAKNGHDHGHVISRAGTVMSSHPGGGVAPAGATVNNRVPYRSAHELSRSITAA
jgi:hypothetical protein